MYIGVFIAGALYVIIVLISILLSRRGVTIGGEEE